MPVPPLWKIRREINRIADKSSRFFGRTLYDPVRKPIYDLASRWLLCVTPGQQALTDRVAVFVIYQPKGLAASLHLTLQHLRENRYSVLLVSNGPLRPEDRATLLQNSAVVLERPNVGYDFGAYRDGIRHLWSLRHDLSRLVLMNDSTWFPLRRDDDSLTRMEALGADLAGHIFKTESNKKRGKDHIESHLLMISKAFLASADFRDFWNDYRMSDARLTTIEYGEKGFSQRAIQTGWTVKALIGREWFIDCLESISDDQLGQVLKHTADGFPTRMRNADFIRLSARSGTPWRQAYIDWAYDCLSNTNAFVLSGAFIMPAMVYGHLGFVKKGRDVPFNCARKELIELERQGIIPPLDECVRREVLESVRTWIPPRDPSTSLARKVPQTVPARS